MSVDSISRLEAIRAQIEEAGSVKVSDLASTLGVSEMTIRRDLDSLAEHGLVRRIRGGAMALGPELFAERFGRQAKAKDRIAAKLMPLVGATGAIGIDASSTLRRVAGSIGGARDLTVLTNSPESFAALQNAPGVTPLLTGGQLDRRTGSLVGPLAARATQDLFLRILFVSAAGIDPEYGTFEMTLEESDIKVALGKVSGQVIAAIDHTKLGLRASARCLSLRDIDILVTDLAPSDTRLNPYRKQVRLL